MRFADLTVPQWFGRKFDWVLSLEARAPLACTAHGGGTMAGMHGCGCSLHGCLQAWPGMDVPGTARLGCGSLHRSRGRASPPCSRAAPVSSQSWLMHGCNSFSPPAMTGPERGALS